MFNSFNPYATNPYAVPYQPQMQQPVQNQQLQNLQQSQQPVQNNSNILWVQGEAGAKSYFVAPNTSVMLIDSEDEYFYIKEVDASNMPKPLRRFKFTEITDTTKTQENKVLINEKPDMSNYITREEFIEEIAKLKPKTRAIKKEVEEDGK